MAVDDGAGGGGEIRVNGLQHGEDVLVAVFHDRVERGFTLRDQVAHPGIGET